MVAATAKSIPCDRDTARLLEKNVLDSPTDLSTAPKRIGVADRGGFGLKEYVSGMLQQVRYEVADLAAASRRQAMTIRTLWCPWRVPLRAARRGHYEVTGQAELMQKVIPAGGRASTMPGYLPLIYLIAGQYLPGQTGPTPGDPTISVNVNLVVLHATVLDRKGGFVSDLQKDDFRVYENGAPQAIRVFDHEDVPVAVGLAVDNSGSMSRKRKDVTTAALAFVRSSNPRDEMFVVNFNERVTFGLPDTQLFSASAGELEGALNGVPANGRTALYDAIEAGLNHLKKATLDKKVMIAISDGGDNASHYKLGQVLEDAGRSDAIIYMVGLFDEAEEGRNPGVLRKIARATGGEAFLPDETSQVVPICEQIAADIRNQYTIGYIPSNEKLDSSQRTIKVTATGRHGEKLLVRTRAGYIAPSERTGRPASSQGRIP